MSFDRSLLPDALTYFEGEGLPLAGRGKWRTTACRLHGGSDSLRVNTASGGWCCMSCGAHGGDVLAHHMAAHGLDFVEAAKALGAWVEDGKPAQHHRPAPLPARDALALLDREANFVAITAVSAANGAALTDPDRARLLHAAALIHSLQEAFHAKV